MKKVWCGIPNRIIFGIVVALWTVTWQASSAYGQQAETDGQPILVVFPVAELAEDPRSGDLAAIIHDALHTGISRLPVVIDESAELEVPEDTETALSVARERNATIAVMSSSFVVEREVTLSVTVLDVRSERVVTGVFARSLIGVSVHNRVADAVSRLTADLQTFIEEGDSTAEVTPIVLRIELLSRDNGMSVQIAGVEHGGTVSEGSLLLPFIPYPLGTGLALDKHLEGHHSERETVSLTETHTIAHLSPLWKQTNRSVHLNYTYGQLAGAGLGYREYLSPDQLFVGLDTYFYGQPSEAPGSSPVYHTDLGLTLGRYFIFDHDSPFRFALSTGGGVVLTSLPAVDIPLFTDYYFNLGNIMLEWNTRPLMLYLRTEVKVGLGLGNNLLGRTIFSVGGDGPLFTLGFGWKL